MFFSTSVLALQFGPMRVRSSLSSPITVADVAALSYGQLALKDDKNGCPKRGWPLSHGRRKGRNESDFGKYKPEVVGKLPGARFWEHLRTVRRKAKWLKQYLYTNTPQLPPIRADVPAFIWTVRLQ